MNILKTTPQRRAPDCTFHAQVHSAVLGLPDKAFLLRASWISLTYYLQKKCMCGGKKQVFALKKFGDDLYNLIGIVVQIIEKIHSYQIKRNVKCLMPINLFHQ